MRPSLAKFNIIEIDDICFGSCHSVPNYLHKFWTVAFYIHSVRLWVGDKSGCKELQRQY